MVSLSSPTNPTHQQAILVASAVAPKFSLIAVLTIAEIVYYAFETWKMCAPSQVSASAYLTGNCFDSVYTKAVLRRACRTMRRGAIRASTTLSQLEIHDLAVASLDHVRTNCPDDVVRLCCSTPCSMAFDPSDLE